MAKPAEAEAYLFERLESGRGFAGLALASAKDPVLGPVVLLVATPADWLLSELFSGASYRRAKKRAWIEWGAWTPKRAAASKEPMASDDVLLDGPGPAARLIRLTSPFREASAATLVDVRGLGADLASERLAPMAMEFRLVPDRRAKAIPEAWIVAEDESWRIERLLGSIHEDDHAGLLLCFVEDRGARMLIAREVPKAKRGMRLAPSTGRTYAAVPGAKNVLIRLGFKTAPALPGWLMASALALAPGEFALVDADEAGRAIALRLHERDFVPASVSLAVDCSKAAKAVQQRPRSPWELACYESDGVDVRRERVVHGKPDEEGAGLRREEREDKAEEGEVEGTEADRTRLAKAKRVVPQKPSPRESAPLPLAARDEVLIKIEAALAEDPEDPEVWRTYANALKARGDAAGVVVALEERLWYSGHGERQQAWDDLAMAAREDAVARATYGAISSLGSSGDALAGAMAATEAWRRIDEASGAMRKKRRWLLWSKIGSTTGDLIEFERRREAILGDLGALGVREHELPKFLRPRLMEKFSSTATGEDPAAVAAFLEVATTFASRSFGDPGKSVPDPEAAAMIHGLQCSFHSSLAIRWVKAGLFANGERALAAARSAAERLDPARHPACVGALAKFAAAKESVNGPGAGDAEFAKALAAAVGCKSKDGTAKSALVSLLHAVASAPARAGLSSTASAALEAVQSMESPVQRAATLNDCAKALMVLGLTQAGVQVARGLIDLPQTAPGSLPRRYLTVCEYAVSAMATMGEGRISAEDATRIVSISRNMHDEFDEFTPNMLAPAFAALGDPWRQATSFANAMRKRNDPHAALIALLSGVRCFAEVGDRDGGLPALEATFEEASAWESPHALKRMRILIRLTRFVPAFGARERGMKIVEALKAMSLREHDRIVRTELLVASVGCAAKLGVPAEAAKLFDEVLEVADSKNAESGDLETVEAVVSSTALIGDDKRGMEILKKAASAAMDRISAHSAAVESSRTDPKAHERMLQRIVLFKLHKSLVGCARSATLLGDHDASRQFLEAALSGLERLEGSDRLDIATTATRGISELPPAARHSLGGKALQILEKVASAGASQHSRRMACETAERLVGEVTSGDTALSAAIVRWTGDEERRIRTRVVSEHCVVGA